MFIYMFLIIFFIDQILKKKELPFKNLDSSHYNLTSRDRVGSDSPYRRLANLK